MNIIEVLQFIHGRFVNPINYPSFYVLFGSIAVWGMAAIAGAVIIWKTNSKIVKGILYGIIILWFAIQYYLKTNFSMEVSPAVFALLSETNQQESKEFIELFILSNKIIPTLSITFIYLAFIILTEIFWGKLLKKIKLSQSKKLLAKKIVIISSLPIFILGIIFSTNYIKAINAKTFEEIKNLGIPSGPFSSLYTSFLSMNIESKNIQNVINITESLSDVKLSEEIKKDSLNIVLIIGESFIKAHSSLYGYQLQTNPNLTREKDNNRLYLFNDVLTTANKTSVVMRDILCCSNSSEGENWFDFPFFPAIFKKAGYNVSIMDNQKIEKAVTNYDFTLNSFLFHPKIQQLSYNYVNDKTFDLDEDLVNYNTNLTNGSPHNLIIYHLMGQHHNVENRYPKDFYKFNADSIKRNESYLTDNKKEYIAHYDNATLYNDHVVNSIINLYKDSKTIVLYFSDHGEEVYDYRDSYMRDSDPLTPQKIKYQYEVPFMIWLSDKYKINFPDIVNEIERAVNRPFITGNISNLLVYLAGIQTSYYRKEFNLIHPSYVCKKRLVEGKNYNDFRNK